MPRGSDKSQELLQDTTAALPAASGWPESHFRVTPGVVDKAAEEAYSNGQCAALAVALQEKTGGALFLIRSAGGEAIHIGAETKPGLVTDIYGTRPFQDWLEDTRFDDPSDPNESAEPITAKEALLLSDFPEQDLETARLFVEAVLDL